MLTCSQRQCYNSEAGVIISMFTSFCVDLARFFICSTLVSSPTIVVAGHMVLVVEPSECFSDVSVTLHLQSGTLLPCTLRVLE